MSLRLPLRNHRLSRAAALTTSPAHNLGHGPNLFGSPYFRAQDYHLDFVRSAQPRVRSCASQNFLRAAATRGCKECHCKQTVRTIVDKPAPIVLRKLWRNHTGSSAAAGCSQFAAKRMRSRKFLNSKHDKIAPADGCARTISSNRSVAMPVSSQVDSGISKLRPTWLCPAR